MVDTSNTYWGHAGKYNDLANKLQELIPIEGPVTKLHKNKALETFRKAVNCYYDLYNNGLWNRARSFAKVFRIPANEYRIRGSRFSSYMYPLVEERMDEIVLAAAREQGFV